MKSVAAESAAYALIDLGADVVTYVPGYGVSQTILQFNKLTMRNTHISFHEEAAFSIAHGAAITGKRSACLMKAHGLAKAGNAFFDSLYTDVTAGFVILVYEDHSGSHSDNIMEIEPILKGMDAPFFHSTAENSYDSIVQAFRLSEQKKLPVTVLFDSEKIANEVEFERNEDQKKTFTYSRDILKHVVHPFFSVYQFKVAKAKLLDGDVASILFPPIPHLPEDISMRYQEQIKLYEPVFNIFKDLRGDVVTGDTSISSSFVLPPYDCIDMVTHIGGSIPLAIGAYLAGHRNVWAVTGDFGFIAAGSLGLLEAAARDVPLKIIIFNNKKAAATGGQPIRRNILYRLLAGYENFKLVISNPQDPFEIKDILTEAAQSDQLKIVVVDY